MHLIDILDFLTYNVINYEKLCITSTTNSTFLVNGCNSVLEHFLNFIE